MMRREAELGIEKLEHHRALVIEQRHAAVEHDLALADARGELVQAERKARGQRTLAQREQLLRGMHHVSERAP